MAITLVDKIKPKSNFPLVDAEDITKDGKSLTDCLDDLGEQITAITPIEVTQAEYDALKDSGEIDENRYYYIKPEV